MRNDFFPEKPDNSPKIYAYTEISSDYSELLKIENKWHWTLQNNLYNIYYDNIPYVDLTVIKTVDDIFGENLDLEEEYDDTSLFQYAYRDFGFANIYQYIENLNSLSPVQKTVTSINFEKLSCQKGIQIYMKYLEIKVPQWKEIIENYKIENPHIEEIEEPLIKRYEYQISPEYINRLERKIEKYTYKLEQLNKLE